jgi:tRNA uridine 5-carboxymethylaminomethyl modification enzyme
MRAENADLRLTARASAAAPGLISPARAAAAAARADAIAGGLRALHAVAMPSQHWRAHGFEVAPEGRQRTAADVLAMPGVCLADVSRAIGRVAGEAALPPALAAPSRAVAASVEVELKYAGYLARQMKDIAAFRSGDALPLPPDVQYRGMPQLSGEEQELLAAARPATVHAASRLQGVRPATLMVLFKLAQRHARRGPPAHDADGGGAPGGAAPPPPPPTGDALGVRLAAQQAAALAADAARGAPG